MLERASASLASIRRESPDWAPPAVAVGTRFMAIMDRSPLRGSGCIALAINAPLLHSVRLCCRDQL
jgi:hypothetical protein